MYLNKKEGQNIAYNKKELEFSKAQWI